MCSYAGSARRRKSRRAPGENVEMIWKYVLCVGFSSLVAAPLSAQNPPIRMGLWEGTSTERIDASPAIVEIMKRQGHAISGPVETKFRTCETPARWNADRAAVDRIPSGCAVIQKESSAQGMHTHLKCSGPSGESVEIESKVSWTSSGRMDLTNRMADNFGPTLGQYVRSGELHSRFVSADCGSVPPGQTVVVK